jgi:hypothetical protein
MSAWFPSAQLANRPLDRTAGMSSDDQIEALQCARVRSAARR